MFLVQDVQVGGVKLRIEVVYFIFIYFFACLRWRGVTDLSQEMGENVQLHTVASIKVSYSVVFYSVPFTNKHVLLVTK